MSRERGVQPRNKAGKFPQPQPPPNYDNEGPKFCLGDLQPGFTVECLTQEGQAAFARALSKRSLMTWEQIRRAPRHGLGSETIRVKQIKPMIPAAFDGEDKVLVLRYHGTLPMAGVRINDVYHLLWIEPRYNDLYDHGG